MVVIWRKKTVECAIISHICSLKLKVYNFSKQKTGYIKISVKPLPNLTQMYE